MRNIRSYADMVAEQEAVAAIKEYEMSRDRYLYAYRSTAQEQVAEAFALQRKKLATEIEHLRMLARARSDARAQALAAYAECCPLSVRGSDVFPPRPADKTGASGAEKLYKDALKAHRAFAEVADILMKRRVAFEAFDRDMQSMLRKKHDELVGKMETPAGLATAFKRDPLLARAYARMKSAVDRRDALRTTADTRSTVTV